MMLPTPRKTSPEVHFNVADSSTFMADFDRAMILLAKHMAARSAPHGDPKLLYDMLADAVVWSDEWPELGSNDNLELANAVGWLRLVVRHRTCVMLGQGSEYEPFWRRAQELFPTWVGFRPERCVQTDAVARCFDEGGQSVRRLINQCPEESPTNEC